MFTVGSPASNLFQVDVEHAAGLEYATFAARHHSKSLAAEGPVYGNANVGFNDNGRAVGGEAEEEEGDECKSQEVGKEGEGGKKVRERSSSDGGEALQGGRVKGRKTDGTERQDREVEGREIVAPETRMWSVDVPMSAGAFGCWSKHPVHV